jgi:hypothetical protein
MATNTPSPSPHQPLPPAGSLTNDHKVSLEYYPPRRPPERDSSWSRRRTAKHFRTNFYTLPDAVSGNWSTTHQRRGRLNPASRSLTLLAGTAAAIAASSG